MVTLENAHLKIIINTKGAELNSIYNKKLQLEYMWSGDPVFWGKKSPALFPIVGALKKNTFYYNDRAYHLARHGFAREMEFAVTEQTAASVTFSLQSNEATLQIFPFHFQFNIIYSIRENSLDVLYRVVNTGNESMYFSVGGHPAFRIPLSPGNEYNDYFLEFNELENSARWPIADEGLIEGNPVPFLNYDKRVPLTRELFYHDAIVFKDLHSTKMQLLSGKSSHGLEFDFKGFPYLGIWAAKGADFVCIEPWCGIADSVKANQQLKEKEGINQLNAKEEFERSWTVTVF